MLTPVAVSWPIGPLQRERDPREQGNASTPSSEARCPRWKRSDHIRRPATGRPEVTLPAPTAWPAAQPRSAPPATPSLVPIIDPELTFDPDHSVGAGQQRGRHEQQVRGDFWEYKAGHRHGASRRAARRAAIRCRGRALPGSSTASARTCARCRRRASMRSCSATRTTGPTSSRSTRPRPRPWPMSSAGFATKITVPFGVNVLWDPMARVALAAATGAALRARDLHRHLCLGHGPVDSRCRRGHALPRPARPPRPRAALQHLGGVRLVARSAAAWPTGREAPCFPPFRTRFSCRA